MVMLIRSIGHHLLTGQDFALFGEAGLVYPACLRPSIEIHGFSKNPFCAAGAFMLFAGGALLFQRLGALLAGGHWANSANCGSRARNATNSRLNVNANYGCQGQARIRGAKQLRLNDKAMSRKPWGKTHDGGAAGLVCKAERLAARCILMKRYGNLFPKIVDENNLMLAYTLAKKGKSKMYSVHRFDQYKEKNLAVIRQTLLDKTFTTSKYQEKIVYEPKKRTIYVLPFSPDRIVQHALMNVVIPIWSKFFIHDSYACIEGKGIHSGSRRTMEFVRRNAYCLKCDISKFYPSIDHDILMNIIRRKIKCKDTLWLIENIVYSYPGGKNVPIGNFTSQWMGNLYLNELDHYVKNVLKIKDYIRYCDDFLFFHNNKAVLRDVAARVEEFVGSVLKLRLSKCDLFPVGRGVDFLGYRHFRGYVLLRKRTAKRVAKRLKALPGLLAHGEITPEHCRAVLASATGWLKWANTYNFQRAVHLSELVELANGACRQQREAKAVALQ